MSEVVEVRVEGPGKNALSLAVMEGLLARLREAAGRPVLLEGAGDAFSAGLNLKELATLDRPGMEAFVRTLEALVSALYTSPGPTVAHVTGHAIAGGCILALCCDQRVARQDEGARLGLNEVAIGLTFPPAILRMVRERVPARHLATVLLGAGLHPPAEALRLGLVDEVAPAADSGALARARLTALAAHPADAYAATKAALRGRSLLRLAHEEEARTYEVELQAALAAWASEEVKARIAAALPRRR
jgi:enoyl-CoA hydratase/carnithine racemase